MIESSLYVLTCDDHVCTYTGCALIVLNRHYISYLHLDVAQKERHPMRLKDFNQLSRTFWVLALACCMHYGSLRPFIAFGIHFISTKYRVTSTQAAAYVGYVYLTASFALPACGIFIDRFGRRAPVCVFSVAMLLSRASV